MSREYKEYLHYMWSFEEEVGHYPMELSNDQWMPFSEREFNELKINEYEFIYGNNSDYSDPDDLLKE